MNASVRRHFVLIAVVLGLCWSAFSGGIVGGWMRASASAGTPYLGSILATLSDLLVMTALLWLAAGKSPLRQTHVAGLRAPLLPALRWMALWWPPILLAAWLWRGGLHLDGDAAGLVWKGVAAPLAEEWLYRGLAMGALMHWAGWRWWPPALLQAACFGIVHLGQGQGLADGAGVVAITAVGGLLFGWLFQRWGGNLWPPVLLHIALNLQWSLFGLGDDAVGGWPGNVLRAAAVIAAIVLTLRMAPQMQSRDA